MLEPKKQGRPSKKPSIAELDMLYKYKTAQEIADEYNVHILTVRRWIAEARKELQKDEGNN